MGLIIWISILKSVVWKVDGSNDGWMDGFFSVMDESNWKGKWNVALLFNKLLRDFKNMRFDILKKKKRTY